MVQSLLLILLLGSVPAVLLTRSILVGAPLGAAVVLLTSAVGATMSVLFGWPTVRCVLGTSFVVVLAAVWARFRHGERRTQPFGPPHRVGAEIGLLALFGIPAIASFTLFAPVPLMWDARSVWWFHASWFQYGGDVARLSMVNPRFAFSHPEYPAGVPASIATLWRLAGSGEDLRLAQTFTAILTGIAMTALAAALVHHRRGLVPAASALALIVASSSLAEQLTPAGYVDLLGAALLVTSLSAFVGIRSPRLAVGAGALALAGASLTKNEGLVFGIAVVILAALMVRHIRRGVIAFGALALLPALAWQVAVRSVGVTVNSDLGPERLLGLWKAEPLRRVGIAVPRVMGETAGVIGPAVGALLLLALACSQLRSDRRHSFAADLRAAATLVVAAVVTDVIAVMIYGAGRFEIQWWLNSSVVRVSTTPKLFALASLAMIAGIAFRLAREVLANGKSVESKADSEAKTTESRA